MKHQVYIYKVRNPGDNSAGIDEYHAKVVVEVNNDPGGEPGEFLTFMKQSLSDWFDGSSVNLEPHYPTEWGNPKQLTCSCGDDDPAHLEKTSKICDWLETMAEQENESAELWESGSAEAVSHREDEIHYLSAARIIRRCVFG